MFDPINITDSINNIPYSITNVNINQNVNQFFKTVLKPDVFVVGSSGNVVATFEKSQTDNDLKMTIFHHTSTRNITGKFKAQIIIFKV